MLKGDILFLYNDMVIISVNFRSGNPVSFRIFYASTNNEYKRLAEHYYTLEEIKKFYTDLGNTKHNYKLLQKISKHKVTDFARIRKFKNKETLYSKSEIDEHISKIKKEKEIVKLCDTTTSDYYNLFLQIIKLDNIIFLPKTKELWFNYVKLKIKNIKSKHQIRIKRVINLRNTTKVLVDATTNKEFFELTESEMNLQIFNNVVPRAYRKEIYMFISTINESLEQFGKKLINLGKLNFEYNEQNGQSPKTTYSVDEYLSLTSYVRDYEKHKKLAVEDVKTALSNITLHKDARKVLSNIRLYKKYDSMWLYVLLHLNNGWRNGTVIDFPRYPSKLFDKYNLTDIQSLENLQLTCKDAEKIIKYYEYQWYKHNKNQQKATFYCSSILTMPMAFAILICEFRCRMLHVHEESFLINFYNKRNLVSGSIHNFFFKDFTDGFRFESRKMNRTVLSLIESVVKATLNNDPIEIARHLRGHTTGETTNTYIVIPQEHMDFISKQLFPTGYGGFIYDKVANLLIGDTPEFRIIQTERALKIKELLGDVVKLEDTATYLKYLSQERQELGKYLEELPKEELQKKMNLINLGLSPAKEENYQCFFGECIAHQRECNKCAFSIWNFYSLTTICERVKRILVKYQDSFKDKNIPEGARTKLFNLLLNDYDIILTAKSKFGEEIIEMFLDIDFTEFDSTLNSIEEPDSLKEPRLI